MKALKRSGIELNNSESINTIKQSDREITRMD